MTVSTVAVCCDDLGLMSDARRLCAMAGLDVEVTACHDARRWWPGAAAVLIDPAAAGQILVQGLPRRSRVALLIRADNPADWRVAVAVGAEQVAVIPDDERALLGGVLALPANTGGATVVACVPASGGAGASTVASALALASARRGAATLLIDADPVGGGLDLLFGLERANGVRWPDLHGPAALAPTDALPDGLLVGPHGLALLSWDRRDPDLPADAAAWVALLPVARSGSDLVVVDLPRRVSSDEAATVDVALLVVRAGVRQTVAAARAAAGLRAHCPDVRVVVRGIRRGGLAATEVAAAVGLPLAAQLPDDRRVAAAADEGQLPRLLGRLPFDSLADELVARRRTAA